MYLPEVLLSLQELTYVRGWRGHRFGVDVSFLMLEVWLDGV